MVLSAEPDTRVRPYSAGLMARLLTGPVCPSSVALHAPVSRSQTLHAHKQVVCMRGKKKGLAGKAQEVDTGGIKSCRRANTQQLRISSSVLPSICFLQCNPL